MQTSLTEVDGELTWSIPTHPRSELAWVPAGAWLLLTFLAVLAATVLEGRVDEPLRLAPVAAMVLGLVPVGLAVNQLRSTVLLSLVAGADALEIRVAGGWLARRRAEEAWAPPSGLTWREGRLVVPWEHRAFAKLRAPQAAHFLDGRVRVGRAIALHAWVPVEEGLAFLTRCRHQCLRKLGGEGTIERELRRLRAAEGDSPS